MKIVIVGAGISGCVAYLLLTKHLPKPPSGEDHFITIYEAYDTKPDTTASDRGQGETHSSTLVVGGGLGIGPNGLNVIRRLDENLLRDVVRGGYVVPVSNLKSKNGRVLVRTESKASPPPDGDGSSLHMVSSSRHALWRSLRVRIPEGVIINKRIAQVLAKPNGQNVVSFVDESPAVEADLVIGADGLKSTTKLALFPEETKDPFPPHYEGLVGVGGFIPSEHVKQHVEKGSMNFVFGGNGFFGYFFSESTASAPDRDSPYQVSEPGENLAWWSTYSIDSCPDPSSLDMEAVTRQLRERHKDWKDPVIQRVLESLKVDHMYPTWTVPPLPTWQRDGVVLVGDAAHALPPTSGQGTSQALEDVEALTLFLAHHLNRAYRETGGDGPVDHKQVITTAAERYMTLRQPRVSKILETAKRMQNSKRDKGTISETIMYGFMWVIGRFPSLMTKQTEAVFTYNVAEDVKNELLKG